jgi:hypothetical protein
MLGVHLLDRLAQEELAETPPCSWRSSAAFIRHYPPSADIRRPNPAFGMITKTLSTCDQGRNG